MNHPDLALAIDHAIRSWAHKQDIQTGPVFSISDGARATAVRWGVVDGRLKHEFIIIGTGEVVAGEIVDRLKGKEITSGAEDIVR